MNSAITVPALIAAWRTRVSELRGYAADPQATTLERCADELEHALAASAAEPLTLAQAAAESGLAIDTIGKLVRQGKLTNAGRPRAPLVLRAELPRKAVILRPPPDGATSRTRIARSVVNSKSKEPHDG